MPSDPDEMHRLDHLIAAIASHAELLATSLGPDHADRACAEGIAKLALEAENVVARLRSPSHDPSADLFRQLVENLPELAWTALSNGHIDFYNRRWYEYTGTTLEQMEGWGWKSVHAPDMVEAVAERWSHSLESGEPFEMEFPLRGADGVFRWFLTRVLPLRDSHGRITRWIGTNTQIDAQRRLLAAVSEAESRLKEENALNASLLRLGDAFARELDDQKLLQLITDEATQLTGAQFGAFFFNVEKAEGGSYMLYTLSGVSRSAFDKFPMPRATPLFGPTFRGEAPIRLDDVRKDPRFGRWGPQPAGHLPVVSYLAVPVITADGAVLGGLFFGHGEAGRFTAQHERLVGGISSQASVALMNARLYRSLREERERAKEAYEVASTADRRKDEFLAMLGHELRNPLAPMLTALQLMALRGDDKTQKERTVIERQLHHLVRLVDDLLDVSRITRGKVELNRERLELSTVLARAIEVASPLLEKRRHRVVFEPAVEGVYVAGDAVRLAQVFSNLLTNAAKFTAPGGQIALRATVAGAKASVTVSDNGVGIPERMLPRIFDLFVQGERTLDRSEGGLGIGLTLVKSLVTLHGGEVDAASDGPGTGSRFTVTLPLVSADAEIAGEPREPPPRVASRRQRVLVVDDNVDAVETLASALREFGHEVATAHDGPDALSLARRFKPEVAILDIGLPGMDGYQLAGQLRATLGDGVRLAAITGYGQESDKARARDAGFDDHFVKPVDLAALESFVSKAPSLP